MLLALINLINRKFYFFSNRTLNLFNNFEQKVDVNSTGRCGFSDISQSCAAMSQQVHKMISHGKWFHSLYEGHFSVEGHIF